MALALIASDEDALHLDSRPLPTAGRIDLSGIQFCSDRSQRRYALAVDIYFCRQNRSGTLSGLCAVGLTCLSLDFHESILGDTAAAQLGSTFFRCLERGFGPLANGFSLLFFDSSEDVNDEAVGGRHIDGDEVHTGLHETRDEMDVACEPIQLRDNKVAFWRLHIYPQKVLLLRDFEPSFSLPFKRVIRLSRGSGPTLYFCASTR